MRLKPNSDANFLPWVVIVSLLSALALAGCGEDTTVGRQTATSDTEAGSDSELGGTDTSDAGDDDEVGASDAQADTSAIDTSTRAGDGAASSCPGGPFCPCLKDSECDAGVCLDTADGKLCTKNCGGDNSCPNGWDCKLYGAVDQVSLCVPKHLSVCAPCEKHADCQIAGDKQAWCLDYADKGHFCGGACTQDSDCPATHACVEAKDGAAVAKQCRLKDPEALCPCSSWAQNAGLKTLCTISNSNGACQGTRGCSAAGLTACNAKVPGPEVCNAEDDNCDGKIDNLPVDAVCFKKAFESGGSSKACAGDAQCPAGEGCSAGACKNLIGQCPGKPTCTTGGVEICTDAATPKKEACNQEDDDCDGLTDEDFWWVDLAGGASLAVGASCGSGACAGGQVQCQTQGLATCTTAIKAKKDTCNGEDDDCNGQTDDGVCDDSNACTTDLCDAVAASCAHTDTVDCGDGNPCTLDSCDAKLGACVHTPQPGVSCSDGDACSVGDSCVVGAQGVVACQPGPTLQACDDANLCTDDSCDPAVGCVNLPNAGTQACYDGPLNTLGIGSCVGGKKLCMAGVLGPCVDQILPNPAEACEGLDDNCNGLTDEVCSTGDAQMGFVTVGEGTVAGDQELWLEIGGDSVGVGPVNAQGAGGKSAWLGLLRWIGAWWP